MCQAVICLALVLCVFVFCFFGGGGNRLYWATSSWLLSILRISSSSLSPSCMNKLFMPSLKPSLWSLFLPLWMLMHCKYDVTSTGIHSALVSFSLLIVVRHTGTRTWVYEWVSPHHRFNVILVKELRDSQITEWKMLQQLEKMRQTSDPFWFLLLYSFLPLVIRIIFLFATTDATTVLQSVNFPLYSGGDCCLIIAQSGASFL